MCKLLTFIKLFYRLEQTCSYRNAKVLWRFVSLNLLEHNENEFPRLALWSSSCKHNAKYHGSSAEPAGSTFISSSHEIPNLLDCSIQNFVYLFRLRPGDCLKHAWIFFQVHFDLNFIIDLYFREIKGSEVINDDLPYVKLLHDLFGKASCFFILSRIIPFLTYWRLLQ